MQNIPDLPAVRAQRGFSLIEMIVVLILLGIMAAVAIARFTDSGANERAAADQLRVHLRQAHGNAMNSDSSWGIQAGGGTYFFFADGDPSVPIQLPGEAATIEIAGGFTPTFTVSFDNWGRPYNVANPVGNDPVASPITIDISATTTITITPDTGFIP